MEEPATVRNELGSQVRPLQVIVGALAAGVVAFGVVAYVIGRNSSDDPQLRQILTIVLAFLVVAEVPTYLIIRQIFMKNLRRQFEDAEPGPETAKAIFPGYLTLTIIAAALLEGVAFFALIITLLTGVGPALIVPVLAVIGLLAIFPTVEKLVRFVNTVLPIPWNPQ